MNRPGTYRFICVIKISNTFLSTVSISTFAQLIKAKKIRTGMGYTKPKSQDIYSSGWKRVNEAENEDA